MAGVNSTRPVAKTWQRGRRHWRTSFTSGDRLSLGLLVVLPIALYLPTLIAGYVEAPGDDLVQNLPLRILAGQMLRAGRLPAWDAYIWSGTPLLAGWNAGAMFPGTLLFAILPIGLAWTINLILAPLLAGVGMYLLMRRLQVGPLGALLAALVFSYTGFMSGQIVHLGLVQGTAFLPFVLLAVEDLASARTARAIVGNVTLLGVALGLTVLAGDPRALSSTAIATGIYAIALAIRKGRALFGFLATLVAGAAFGALLSAIQWLPGLTFLSNSQRRSAAYTFFGTGSLGARQIISQMLVPFLLGGNGNFGLPSYDGYYNLPEITIGCGLVALCCACVYLFPLLHALGRGSRGERRTEVGRHLGTLYLLMLVGFLLSLGITTPLGHLLVHVPFFGNERLQNRNAVLLDFPLAVLIGYFIEDLGVPDSPVRKVLQSPRALAGLLPPACCVALVAYALARPSSLQTLLHVPFVVPHLMSRLSPYLITTIVLAAIVGAVVLLASRLSPFVARRLVAAVVLAEVALYVSFAAYAEIPNSVLAPTTSLNSALRGYTGPAGRFAVYNPALESVNGDNPWALEELGITDLNIIQRDASVEGYGSIVNGTYQNFTSTHYEENLSTAALGSESFNTLDLRTLATLPIYFGEPIPANAPIPITVSRGVVHRLTGAVGLPPFSSGPWPVEAAHPATFVLAAPRPLRRATILLDPAKTYPTQLSVQVLAASGHFVTHTAVVHDGVVHVNLAGIDASGIRVIDSRPTPAVIGAAVVVTSDPDERLLLDGALQGALSPPHWGYAGTLGPFSIWQNSETAGLAWLQAPSSKTPEVSARVPGAVNILTNSFGASERIEVQTDTTVTLVRSEGFAGGWTARVQAVSGGPTKVVPVRRFGLVQAITLPKGRWVVVWRYAPASLLLGAIGSAFGVVALIGMLVLFRKCRTG